MPELSLASSRGLHFNSGNGFALQPLDIGHPDYLALVEPETAFWALVRKPELAQVLGGGPLLESFRERRETLRREMQALRFGSRPSTAYVNPTDRCNLDCGYCYLPRELRRDGQDMTAERLCEALGTLRAHFRQTLPAGVKPAVVFHGAEPLLARTAVFAAIDAYRDDFQFAVQTNGTLLDEAAAEFLTERKVSVGLSLDGAAAEIADRSRRDWGGHGVSGKVLRAIELLKGYPAYSVICTMTTANLEALPEVVERFHALEVPVCMLNPVRCTQPGGQRARPNDAALAAGYQRALERSHALYRETGRKLVVANFANVLLAIVAPTARRLMCDVAPCGGGRCFVAVSSAGDLYPCSEFIGLPEFRGGNLFTGSVQDALASDAFARVTGRTLEGVEPCGRCAIRNYCGSPCPAEVHSLHGTMDAPGAFCELYEEQVRYAFRLIADGREQNFLPDGWDRGLSTTFALG